MTQILDLFEDTPDVYQLAPTTSARHRVRVLFIGVVLASLLIGFLASHFISAKTVQAQRYQLQSSGLVNLTERELINVAKSTATPIYWAGPIVGYTYQLTVEAKGSSILKYIPATISDSSANANRLIATYPEVGAWRKSLQASVGQGYSSFKNSDGSLVFYSIDNPNDIFMAFPNKDIQIEIFDSRAGQALSLSVLVGQIRAIA